MGRIIQNISRLVHLDQERTLAARQIIRRAHSCKNLVNQPN